MTYYKKPPFDWKSVKPLLEPKYRCIYADPPWFLKGMYGEAVAKWAAKRGYDAMTLDQLKEIRIKDLVHRDGAHLYLWSSNALIPSSLELMKAWGFEYITAITWLKEEPANGQYFRSMTEQCLFGTKKARNSQQKLPIKTVDGVAQRGETAFYSPRLPDFRKPDKMRELIERVSHGPFLEIWPKEPVRGWDVWDGENGIIRRPDLSKKISGRPDIVRKD